MKSSERKKLMLSDETLLGLRITELYKRYNSLKKQPGSDNVFAPSLNKCYKHRENHSFQNSAALINVPHKRVNQRQVLNKEPKEKLLVAENVSADTFDLLACGSEQNIVDGFSSTSVMEKLATTATVDENSTLSFGHRLSETWLEKVKITIDKSPLKDTSVQRIEAKSIVSHADSCFLSLESDEGVNVHIPKAAEYAEILDLPVVQLSDNEKQLTADISLTTNSISVPGEKTEVTETKGFSYKKRSSVSDNFVTLNMKAKTFSRKSSRLSGSRYKRQQWRKRKLLRDNEEQRESHACYNCGKLGHWARSCTMKVTPEILGTFDGEGVQFTDDVTGVFEEATEDCQQVLLQGDLHKQHLPTQSMISKGICLVSNRNSFDAFFKTNVLSDDLLIKKLGELGYGSFMPGQQEAIRHVLSGNSTLLVLPTGGGKSLCYQLPAYMYTRQSLCFVLVISPLISLMNDQVKNLPCGLSGVCIHNSLSHEQKQQIFADLEAGLINILFVAPEALISGSFSSIQTLLYSNRLPPIAFVCIDEVHCLSEWGHNFRSAYLRLPKILKKQLGVQCILGLTATANKTTISHITESLQIKAEHVIVGSAIPENLHISVSCETDRLQALLDLLQSAPFNNCNSIIIYCTRQQTTEKVAQLVRISTEQNYSDIKNKSSIKQNMIAEAYHAGLSMGARKRIQSNFMNGKLRIVVATVAFGMGLNKSDVRAVIHYNMPKGFESFVQEIGRAGRDGNAAYCHIFIEKNGNDLRELQRHIHGNGVDYFSVKKLCQQIFSFSEKDEYEVALSIDELTKTLDANEETISTLLCYLENDNWIEVYSPLYDTVTIKCYGPQLNIAVLADKFQVIESAVKHNISKSCTTNQLSFSLTEVANDMKSNSMELLQGLQSMGNNVIVESSNLSFYARVLKATSNEDKDCICQDMLSKIQKKERKDLHRLQQFSSVLMLMSQDCTSKVFFKDIIAVYFNAGLSSEYLRSLGIEAPLHFNTTSDEILIRDIHVLMGMYPDNQFTGRAIARVFHGIGSPCYPADVWGSCPFWRKHLDCDFYHVCDIATKQIIQTKL
ncbi:PREDICTED: ATP-dependent DNA helicase Q4-like isoform X3 [Amphimedon queenslandica]|uniref:DNA 3'-5' helicase n=1 Tax=Amphimedon queenslandica TaxID=400682 RepID=A0AAN0IZQ9_AMPQE|nr:PREDICTED: ATP-dependent DNA helicase Q4-like isoform X3 [Amphimedon queenslandica]XP_019849940.1 PREDICTED: ATP-dependent DNA helicase Q4-like isoform X3 [Amphimedon queenslandica]XP_019849941.1 PREDICTED: ATP-dependent DNA helicase Q4-like isoform X3 [Amphimedon queenslandica]|eukprot:XP_019849939.1 PREDICTED: ATP-dependent DNA helicase Q4-like isoform X3 [Amphimedon queenslandica]